MKVYEITVEYVPGEGDDPAVYIAENEELGLVAEARTLDVLEGKINDLLPDLYELNVKPKLQSAEDPRFVMKRVLNFEHVR